MAVVTLKDLMDPLSKIAKATEDTAAKLDTLIASSGGGAGQLSQALITELQTQTGLLKEIATNTKNGAISVGGKPVDQDKLKEGAESIKLLGGGAASLAMGLITFMLVPKSAIKKFSTTISEIMAIFDQLDGKKVKQGAEAFDLIAGAIGQFARNLALAAFLLIPGYIGAMLLKSVLTFLLPTFEMIGKKEKTVSKGAEVLGMMGDSLLSFAKGLALVAIASIIGIVMTPVIVLAMILIGGAFALLGMIDKPIRRGARALKMMGQALIYFSIGLVTFALASLFILMKPVILLAMLGTIILIGGAFAILGLVSNYIRRGAIAMVIMAIGLVSFSIGYLVFSLVSKNVTLEEVGIQAAIIAGIGLAFGLAGTMYTSIIKGALSIAAIGIGLLVFSLGYLPFAMVTKDMTLESVGIQAAIIAAIGVEFGVAGLAAAFIALGAGAFIAAGISLIILSVGLAAFKKVGFTQDDSEDLAIALTGVKSAFLGNADADEGFFSKLGGAITGAVDAVRMVEAAAGFTAAGLALGVLSYGLNKFKEIKWTEQLSQDLVVMLSGVTTAFALAGEAKQVPSTSFFGQMFGFKSNSVYEGIRAVMGAGRALKDIAEGLKSFQALIKSGVNFGKPDGNGNYKEGTLGYAVTNTVGFIRTAFAAVAGEGNVEAGGFFNQLFGIKKNKVQEGIKSVMGTGAALKDIAEGLKSFQAMIDQGVNFGTPDANGQYEKGTLGYAVTNTIGFIREAFAAVGGEEQVQAGGMFNQLLGIKKNKVQEGVDAVKGVGAELTNIANGLKIFQEMIKADVNWDVLADAVTKTVGFVGDAFAAIGGKEQTDSAFFGLIKWDENLVAKGVTAVKGAGAELTNIANGIKIFADMIKNQIDFNAVGTAVKNTLTLVGDAFAVIGGKEQTDSALFGLISWDENLVQKGIENVKGAGETLIDIAKGLEAFQKLKQPEQVAEGIKKIFTSIGDTLSFYYDKPTFSRRIDHMQGFITEISDRAEKNLIHKAADGMKKMAAAVNSIDKDKARSFADLFKGAGELNKNTMAFLQLVKAVEQIKELLKDQTPKPATGTQAAAAPAAGAQGAKPAPPQPNQNMNAINTTLQNLNSTLIALPAKIGDAVANAY